MHFPSLCHVGVLRLLKSLLRWHVAAKVQSCLTINVPLFKKLRDIIFLWDNNFMSHFEGHFEGAKTRDNLRGQKSLGRLKMSLEMAHKVIAPQKKIMSHSFLNSGTLIVARKGLVT